jgi:tRNA modification GTPase
MKSIDDTIAAIATPFGEGALAIVRVSGSDALTIADRCFRPAGKTTPSQARSHTLHFGHVLQEDQLIDEVVLGVMHAPRTFTREHIVEITCHGGIVPAKAVLDAVLKSGARLADPGEFTRRAFLNGRIDLAQAEAVADVIRSRTELALRSAEEQLSGRLSGEVNRLRDDLLRILAHVEAHIDFPDEDIEPETAAGLEASLHRAIECMDRLLRTANEGAILRHGIRAAIIGQPNVGKSSLLNQLLGKDRAIVSQVPGTTRDTIEEVANIRGLPLVLVDTAGLRDSGDEIEVEGVRRSRLALQRAEMVLHVLDQSQPLGSVDAQLVGELQPTKRILIRNKADLPSRLEMADPSLGPVVHVSCLTGEGIDELKSQIAEIAWSGHLEAEMLPVMINSRHEDALRRARMAAARATDALRSGAALDLVAVDLRISVAAVGEIVGKTATEDLLDVIFSQFCIGK